MEVVGDDRPQPDSGHKMEHDTNYHEETREIQSYMVFGTTFDVDTRYTVVDAIGQGAYGIVCAAKDEVAGEMVAIKKITNAFEHHTFAKRTLREIIILRLLQHENIIGLTTILRPLDPHNFDDLYVISELMETDLSSIIKSPQPLSDAHVQFFLYQILRGLKYIHTSNVIHRDLKPRNLLVNSNCDLKICDFGLARVDFAELQWKVAAMTDYVATRWYRAPEVILSWKKYTKAIDMWSVGCILAELLGRKPLFPGSDSQHQLALITQILGTPSEHTVANIKQEKALSYLRQLPRRDPMDFADLYPDANQDALDLLEKLLEFDPADRITVEESLAHPYLKALHFPEDEPANSPVDKEEFEFERSYLSSEQIRDLILKEIDFYHSAQPLAKKICPNDNPMHTTPRTSDASAFDNMETDFSAALDAKADEKG